MMQAVFLHIGQDTTLPSILVRSIRAHNPQARILQCTDRSSPAVEGVDLVHRLDDDASKLMTFRLRCFSEVPIDRPSLFLDTDMFCARGIDLAAILRDADIAVCVREWDAQFNIHFGDMDLRQYEGRTVSQVYPYLACATITRSNAFWADCLADLLRLDPKFHQWFGDQEAIRNVVRQGRYRFAKMRESVYACLPGGGTSGAVMYHFKGAARKKMMIEFARRAGFA